MQRNDSIQWLYTQWHEAETRMCEVCDTVSDDYSHPRFIKAAKKSHALLHELLRLNPSLQGALVKLKIASYYDFSESETKWPFALVARKPLRLTSPHTDPPGST